MEFLRFWGECVRQGWELGHGLVWQIESFCAFIGVAITGIVNAVKLVKRKRGKAGKAAKPHTAAHGWLHEWWHSTENKIVTVSLGIGLILFFTTTICIAPFHKYDEEHHHHLEAITNLTNTSTALRKTQDELKESEKRRRDLLERRGVPKDVIEEAQSKMVAAVKDTINEYNKAFVDTQRSNNPIAAALAAIASKPVDMPKITGDGGRIDLNAAETIAETIHELRTKESAKVALSRVEGSPLDIATLAVALPHIDYYVKEFEDSLRVLAAQSGDTISSTYTNAALVPFGQYATIRMQTNSNWEFRVWIRKDNQGYGEFNWLIVSSFGPLFKCTFSGTNYSFDLQGGPPGNYSGNGEITSIEQSKLPVALTYLIAVQKSAYPLTNVLNKPAPK